MAALGSRPLLLMCILVLVVLTLVAMGKSGREYFDTQTPTTAPAVPATVATIPVTAAATPAIPTPSTVMMPTPTTTATLPVVPAIVPALPVPLSNPQQSITSMVPKSIVQNAPAPPAIGSASPGPITSYVTSTTFNAPAAPGNPSMVPSNAAATVSAAITPAAEIPPWQDDVIGNWQLIQFDSMSLPTDVVGLSSDPGVSGVYAVKVVNPQHYYFICTMTDVAKLGLTSTSPISTGHKPSQYPLGYGGATCVQNPTAVPSQAMTIGVKSVSDAATVPNQSQSVSTAKPSSPQNLNYVAGSSPPLIQTNLTPTQMSLPFADCPFQTANNSKYVPLFDELHNLQNQMQDDAARLKFVSDRLHRIGKQSYYPMPLTEANAAY